MSWLSRIAPSFFSASNENTLALASVKFDFALVKVEAPIEFNPLGMALSKKRKAEAEDGGHHKTARRLGALFEQLIPSTPKLLSAYGNRISELIETPGVNPEGRSTHGPFQAFVGADATAMWAAATSSTAAISIYLLACLLARVWEPHEAISIWVELVADRKKVISEAFAKNEVISEASLFSARQDTTREELSLWDASARAWLRSADEAKKRETDQANLIVKNLKLPYPTGNSTYEKVIRTWREALVGMEELLNDRPQSLWSGSVPLAIRSWHLYPDMVVLGNEVKNVQFNDNLFTPSASCTIGLESDLGPKNSGIEWSLALSHLNFYGPPQNANSRSPSRLSMDQFSVVVLGGLFRVWSTQGNELHAMAMYVRQLWDILDPSNLIGGNTDSMGLGGLKTLAKAALTVEKAFENQDSTTIQLLKLGRRQGGSLLKRASELSEISKPLFGLCNPMIQQALTEKTDIECGIRYLRELSQQINLGEGEGIIVYSYKAEKGFGMLFEIATARPTTITSGKRNNEGLVKSLQTHFRWLVPQRAVYDTFDDMGHHRRESFDVEAVLSIVESRLQEIAERGEQAKSCIGESDGYRFDDPNDLNLMRGSPYCFRWRYKCESLPPGLGTNRTRDQCYPISYKYVEYRGLLGNERLGLFLRANIFQERAHVAPVRRALETIEFSCSPTVGLQGIDPARLYDYITYVFTTEQKGWDCEAPGIATMAENHQLSSGFYESLMALGFSSTVFDKLLGATVSTELIYAGIPLSKAKWLPRYDLSSNPLPTHLNFPGCSPPLLSPRTFNMLTLPETFACLLYFETGSQGFTKEHLVNVYALSVDNSLFVAEALLSDPAATGHPNAVQRLAGNIGRSGISFLINVKNPELGSASKDYTLVRHEPYDHYQANNFKSTSLHLSLTGWTIPLRLEESAGQRTIDQNVCYVESVISVRDCGNHVSDLNLPILSVETAYLSECEDPSHRNPDVQLQHQYISIDNWEELFDPPLEGTGIVRAHGNWGARLAALAILLQQPQGGGGRVAIIGSERLCLKCLESYRNCYDFLID